MCDIDADLAHIAGTHHVDDVGFEILERLRDTVLVPPECRVEPKSFIQIERQWCARELEVSSLFFLDQASLRGPSNAEERVRAPLRESGQLAARQRYAVDFRKRICKESYTRNGTHSRAG